MMQLWSWHSTERIKQIIMRNSIKLPLKQAFN